MARKGLIPLIASLVLVASFILPALAADGGNAILGQVNTFSTSTEFRNTNASAATGLVARSSTAGGNGVSSTGYGASNAGVVGFAGNTAATGIIGANNEGGTAFRGSIDASGGVAFDGIAAGGNPFTIWGTALQTNARLKFLNRSGVVTHSATDTDDTVEVPVAGLLASPNPIAMGFAMIQSDNVPTVNVRAVVVDPGNNQIKILLNAVSAQAFQIAWFG